MYMRTTSFLSKRQLSPRPVLAAFSLTLSSRVSFTFLRSLSRSEARAESSNVVFAQMNQAARAYPFPSCRRQSFFIRFNGSVLFLYPARRTQEFATWINDEARESDAHMLAPGGPPTRRDLASDTFPPPHLSVEKHSVHQPTLCAIWTLPPFSFFSLPSSLASSYTQPSIPLSSSLNKRVCEVSYFPRARSLFSNGPGDVRESPGASARKGKCRAKTLPSQNGCQT